MSELLAEPTTESPEASVGAGDGAAGTDGAASEPAVASPTPTQASAAIDYASPEFQAAADRAAEAQIARLLEEAAAYEQGQQGPTAPQIDPFAEDFPQQFSTAVSTEAERIVNERLSALQPILEHSETAWAESWASQQFSTIENDPAIGRLEEGQRDAALYASAAFRSRFPNDPAAALKAGAQWVKQRDAGIEQRVLARYQEQMGGVAGTPAEPPAGGAGLHTVPEAGSYDEVIARRIGARTDTSF